jgi:hypothetical protein
VILRWRGTFAPSTFSKPSSSKKQVFQNYFLSLQAFHSFSRGTYFWTFIRTIRKYQSSVLG